MAGINLCKISVYKISFLRKLKINTKKDELKTCIFYIADINYNKKLEILAFKEYNTRNLGEPT